MLTQLGESWEIVQNGALEDSIAHVLKCIQSASFWTFLAEMDLEISI